MVAMHPNFHTPADRDEKETLPAHWVIGILSLLTDVVGMETTIGQILSRTRLEVSCLLEDDDETMAA